MSKVLATTLGLAATVAAPVVAVQQLSSNEEIVPILIDENVAKSEYKGKFGFDFFYFFASAEDVNNKDWWEKVAKVRWDADKNSRIEFHSEFANIDKGYGNENSLNQACKKAYKKETKSQIHRPQGNDTNKTKYERDIWRYCSVGGVLPITLEKSDNKQDKELINAQASNIGKNGKHYLISTRNTKNEWFWQMQEKTLLKKYTDSKGVVDNGLKKFNALTGDNVKAKCENLYNGNKVNDVDSINLSAIFCSLVATKFKYHSTTQRTT